MEKTGNVKVAGSLADGTSVSFSTIAQVVGETLDNPKACTLIVPVYAGSAAYAFGGEVKIVYPDLEVGEYPVVLSVPDEQDQLVWTKNAAKTTARDGAAFGIHVAPVGGWYDKVVNLQNYYLSRKFAISAVETGDALPAEALANGYTFSTLSSPSDLDSVPNGLEVTFNGNVLAVAARTLVKNKTTGLTDFATSVNPWNTTVKLNRATGLVSGTFNAWEWIIENDLANFYATNQKQISNLSHRGVLLFSRDDPTKPPFAGNVLTAGYFLMPATTSTKAATIKATWKASLPFNILFEEKEPTWLEKDNW